MSTQYYSYETSDESVFRKLLEQKHLEDYGFGDSLLTEDLERFLLLSNTKNVEENIKLQQDPDLVFYKIKEDFWIVNSKEKFDELSQKREGPWARTRRAIREAVFMS